MFVLSVAKKDQQLDFDHKVTISILFEVQILNICLPQNVYRVDKRVKEFE